MLCKETHEARACHILLSSQNLFVAWLHSNAHVTVHILHCALQQCKHMRAQQDASSWLWEFASVPWHRCKCHTHFHNEGFICSALPTSSHPCNTHHTTHVTLVTVDLSLESAQFSLHHRQDHPSLLLHFLQNRPSLHYIVSGVCPLYSEKLTKQTCKILGRKTEEASL